MIEDKDMDRLKEVFVTRAECQTDMKIAEEKNNQRDTAIALLTQQQKINNWLTLLIAGGVVTALIKLFLGA